MKMLQKIVLGASMIASLSGCVSEEPKAKPMTLTEKLHAIDNRIPIIADNQRLIINPIFIKPGYESLHELSYTLLTNMDDNIRTYEAIEKRVYDGKGDSTIDVYFKEGYGPAQTLPSGINVHFVDSTFFKPYE